MSSQRIRWWNRRWIVIIEDLPPMPAYREVHGRYFRRKTAKAVKNQLRIALNKPIVEGFLRVYVVERGTAASTPTEQ